MAEVSCHGPSKVVTVHACSRAGAAGFMAGVSADAAVLSQVKATPVVCCGSATSGSAIRCLLLCQLLALGAGQPRRAEEAELLMRG